MDKNISGAILTDAVERTMSTLHGSQTVHFYDGEAFREFLGCLINIVPATDDDPPRAMFPHYTVREYLDSARIPDNFLPFSTRHDIERKFTEVIFQQVYRISPEDTCANQDIWDDPVRTSNQSDWLLVFDEDFNAYCLLLALIWIYSRQNVLGDYNTLLTLAIDILDPSKPHFPTLEWTAPLIITTSGIFEDDLLFVNDIFYHTQFGSVDTMTAAHLLNLLFMGLSSTENLILAKQFIQWFPAADFLRSNLTFEKVLADLATSEHRQYDFSGTIVEISAQIAAFRREQFDLLLEYSTGFYDPSAVLMSFIASHMCRSNRSSKNICALKKLLEAGADASGINYYVSPLQIAVVSWDFEGVSMLLKAGADPNGTGSANGIAWKENTLLHQFNFLHGLTPLQISRQVDYIAFQYKRYLDKEVTEEEYHRSVSRGNYEYTFQVRTAHDRKQVEDVLLRWGAV